MNISSSDSVMNWRNRTKEKLVVYKGGKCEKCGYDNINYLRVFEFHHLNPDEKDFAISGKSYKYETLRLEADKCILLCSNCHKELHEDLDREKREERFKDLDNTLSPHVCKENRKKGWRSRKILKECLHCNKETTNYKYCSLKCATDSNQILPSKEVLLELKKTMSNIEIGKKFGVSEAPVRKKLK